MPQSIFNNGEERMEKALVALKKDLSLVRTGRANPGVLNAVMVSYYGVPSPLSQIAAISVPEAQLLVIKPYDRSSLKDIEKAIQLADLNLVPMNDGTVIRINFPALTEQRRKELVKDIKNMAEGTKVAIRNIRRDMVEQMKKLEKDSVISEDELKRHNDQIQKITDRFVEQTDVIAKEKEALVMEI
ncbi:MAG TPA: ribosome recycling factor [Bacilli bacterium]|nr:MAG: Ribosome-recycling factor [Tenericutes bacterium ADurb.BinA124]HPX83773.1 ribosome recycling factor [Bacilli bacterium]HQC73924.1 ribosome recycling factor [Bacilli bacterium]